MPRASPLASSSFDKRGERQPKAFEINALNVIALFGGEPGVYAIIYAREP
jgi:hypothetical protein